MRRRSAILASVATAVALFPSTTGALPGATNPALEECRALVRDHPEDLESYRCYWAMARIHGLWGEAARALEGHLTLDPSNQRARLHLGFIEADRGRARAEALYREAADGLAAIGDADGEVQARLALARLLRGQGRVAEAGPELEKASGAAESSGDPVLVARVRAAEASQSMAAADYGRALALLGQAESAAFPDGPDGLRSQILSLMGKANWALGLYERALDAYSREADLLRQGGDRFGEAGPRYNIALLAGRLMASGQMEPGEYQRLVEESLETAVQVSHRVLEVKSRLLLGQHLGGDRGVEEFERALAISREMDDRAHARQAMRRLAEAVFRQDPARRAEAYGWVDEAIEDARAAGDRQEIARGLCVRALLSQWSGARERLIEDYGRALEAVEEIRDLQPDGMVRARLFSQWTFPYYRFAGTLLHGLAASPDPEGDLELAFRTIERMRARVLLDVLDTAGAYPLPATDDAAHGRRTEILGEIASLQKRLFDSSLRGEERASVLAHLERLEAEEGAVRDAIARTDPSFARLRAPSFPSLSEIQELLAPGQALLSFQLSGWAVSPAAGNLEGGPWIIVITREMESAFLLPETGTLEDRVAIFLGLFGKRDGSEATAAERLYRDLLGDALGGIDPSVRRLIIVPDGRLHRLPFSALREDQGGKLMAEIYEISYVPSATLWASWKRAEVNRDTRARTLALADPELPAGDGEGPSPAANPWREGLRLEPLTRARQEARTLERALGGGGRVLSGPGATESFLKSAPLGKFGVLHLAAHAIVDDDRPERSAVLLAPGAEEEDGLLQIREILDLAADGQVVLLTGCRSASGTLVRGEGPMGLARAFFQAGARAVIGSLWPVRDDEMEALMKEFSREVARGNSLAGALAAARRARIRSGTPPAAWAGLVVLGNGDLVLLPGGRGWAPGSAFYILGFSAGLLALAALVFVFRKRRPPEAR